MNPHNQHPLPIPPSYSAPPPPPSTNPPTNPTAIQPQAFYQQLQQYYAAYNNYAQQTQTQTQTQNQTQNQFTPTPIIQNQTTQNPLEAYYAQFYAYYGYGQPNTSTPTPTPTQNPNQYAFYPQQPQKPRSHPQPPTPLPSAPPSPTQQLSCPTCSKTFNSPKQLQSHYAAHLKCRFCDFEAVKKVVNAHERAVHMGNNKRKREETVNVEEDPVLSAAKLRILASLDAVEKVDEEGKEEEEEVSTPVKSRFLESPEEIEKWRAERRKNYPTDSNIARKTVEQKDRLERGELVAERKRNPRSMSQHTHKAKKLKTDNTDNAESITQSDEKEKDTKEEGVEQLENNEQVTDNKPPEPKEKGICKYFLKGRCKNGKKCHFAHTRAEKPAPKAQTTTSLSQPKYWSRIKRRPLLKLLLDKEIRKEKNVVLQCIRFIIRNDFFDESSSKLEEKEEVIEESTLMIIETEVSQTPAE